MSAGISTGNLNFPPAEPEMFFMETPMSTSKSVLRKELVRVPAVGNTTFTPTADSIITFRIASNHAVMVGSESYIQLTLVCKTDEEKEEALGQERALAAPGVHSLFKNIDVRGLGSSATFQRIEDYNRYCAIKFATRPKAFSDSYESFVAGIQAFPHERYAGPFSMVWQGTANVSSSLTTGVVTFSDITFDGIICEGDIIAIYESGTAQRGVGVVYQINNASEFVWTCGTLNLPGATEVGMWVYRANSERSHIAHEAHSNATTYTVRLELDFLKQNIPLMLLKNGMEVRIELESADKVLVDLIGANRTTAYYYKVTNPEYHCMLATPHPEQVRKFMNAYKTPRGFVLSYTGVVTQIRAGDTSNSDRFQTNVGVRAAKRVFLVQYDSKMAIETGTHLRQVDSLSTFLRGNLSSYQFLIGSERYPLLPVVANADNSHAEVISHLRQTLYEAYNIYNERDQWNYEIPCLYNMVTTPLASWQARGVPQSFALGGTNPINDATRFVIGQTFSRDSGPDNHLAGVDISNIPLTVEINRSAAWGTNTNLQGTPYYFIVVEHDAYVTISATDVKVLY